MQEPSEPNGAATDHEVRGLFMIVGCGGLIVLIGIVTGLWVFLDDRADREAERERREGVERELAVETSETIRDLIAEHGYHTLREGPWPMIPYPADLDDLGYDWAAVSAHGDQHHPIDAMDRGVVVLLEGTVGSVDPSHHALPEYLRADEPAAMHWVALVRRTIVPAAYSFEGVDVDVEEVDLRMVRVSDRVLIAQGTYRAMPPLSQGAPHEVYEASEQDLADWVADAWNAAMHATPFEPHPALDDTLACPMDGSMSPLSIDSSRDPSCKDDPTSAEACRAHCLRGHPESCWTIARALEHSELYAESDELYLRACHYGLGSGCTNWAAGRLTDERRREPDYDLENDPTLVCLARVFEHACTMADDWGCAMLEQMRMAGEGMKLDMATARAALEARCEEEPGAACMVLGQFQARGDFGPDERALADENFRRACESGGVPRACDTRADQWDSLEPSRVSDESSDAARVPGIE